MKTKKKLIISSFFIVFVVLGLVFWNFLVKKENSEFNLEKVKRGTVLQTVSETGTIKASEQVDLAFEETGRIERIYVEVGEEVARNDELAKLDTSELLIQLSETEALLQQSQAEYKKLLAGPTREEIRVKETTVEQARVALENAEQKLKNVELEAEENLQQAYENALDTLDDSRLKIYNAYNVADNIYRDYFTLNDQQSFNVKENRDKIEKAKKRTEEYIDKAKQSQKREDIDRALSETKSALSDTKQALDVIRDMVETIKYRDSVSSSDKTSLDNQKSYINTAYANIVSAQQTIYSTKITNKKNIDNAKADIETAKVQLKKAEDELNLLTAKARQEDIDAVKAKIKQNEAKISLLKTKISKSYLKSPIQGKITDIKKEEGEVVQAHEPVVSLLSQQPFQIEADIYEEDIVKVKVGDPVTINIVAFPNESLKGKVCAIDPVEKVIDGVVYYKVTIDFGKEKKGLKPGMTADIVIETDKRENVLIIPKEAIKKRNGKNTVWVFENGEVKEKEIEIGLVGDDFAEVVSGLKEGEEIIIR